jgi:hypothetical protein
MIETKNLKELARLQDKKPINKYVISNFEQTSSTIRIFFKDSPFEEYELLKLEDVKDLIDEMVDIYNENFAKKLADAKKAVWNDIAEKGGI